MTADLWAGRLAVLLGELLPRVGRLAAEIECTWHDRNGGEWAGRAALVHRELGRIEAVAAELAAGGRSRSPGRGTPAPDGPRLGGTEGARVDDGSGVRIAVLPPP